MDDERQVSAYDRAVGSLEGVPGVIKTRPSLHRITEPVTGISQTFVVTTVKHREQGDRVFLEIIERADAPPIRVVLPPKVADTIARQRASLAARAARTSRSEAAKRRIEDGTLVPFKPGHKPSAGTRARAKKRRRPRRKVGG